MNELLVMTLLAMPVGTPEPYPGDVEGVVFATHLQKVLIDLDCVDPEYQIDSWNLNEVSWQRWLDSHRQTYFDCRDSPPLADVRLLPTYEDCIFRYNYTGVVGGIYYTAVDREFHSPLGSGYFGNRYFAAYRRMRFLGEFWIYTITATDVRQSVRDRRVALKHIKQLCGDDAYYDGDWPEWHT